MTFLPIKIPSTSTVTANTPFGRASLPKIMDISPALTFREALVISRGQITVNLIALYKALGGGIVGI